MAAGLTLGSVFDSFEKFQACLDEYTKSNGYKFIKRNARRLAKPKVDECMVRRKYPLEWKYFSVTFLCKHFGHYVSTSKGARPNQETFKAGCRAMLSLSANKSKNGLVITQLNLEHNDHPQFSTEKTRPGTKILSHEQAKEMKELLMMGPKHTAIKEHFRRKYDIQLTTRDISKYNSTLKKRNNFKGRSRQQETFNGADKAKDMCENQATLNEYTKVTKDAAGVLADNSRDGTACVVCYGPCKITSNRQIPNLPFCQLCKKIYFRWLSRLAKSQAGVRKADRLPNGLNCSNGGFCVIDVRHMDPKNWCTACHLKKFQSILRRFDTLEIKSHEGPVIGMPRAHAHEIQHINKMNPVVLIERLTDQDLAPFGLSLPTAKNGFTATKGAIDVRRYNKSRRLYSQAPPVRPPHTDLCVRASSHITDPHGMSSVYDVSNLSQSCGRTANTKSRKRKRVLPGDGDDGLPCIKVYVFSCGHACDLCNCSDEARDWLKESGFHSVPPAAEEDILSSHGHFASSHVAFVSDQEDEQFISGDDESNRYLSKPKCDHSTETNLLSTPKTVVVDLEVSKTKSRKTGVKSKTPHVHRTLQQFAIKRQTTSIQGKAVTDTLQDVVKHVSHNGQSVNQICAHALNDPHSAVFDNSVQASVEDRPPVNTSASLAPFLVNNNFKSRNVSGLGEISCQGIGKPLDPVNEMLLSMSTTDLGQYILNSDGNMSAVTTSAGMPKAQDEVATSTGHAFMRIQNGMVAPVGLFENTVNVQSEAPSCQSFESGSVTSISRKHQGSSNFGGHLINRILQGSVNAQSTTVGHTHHTSVSSLIYTGSELCQIQANAPNKPIIGSQNIFGNAQSNLGTGSHQSHMICPNTTASLEPQTSRIWSTYSVPGSQSCVESPSKPKKRIQTISWNVPVQHAPPQGPLNSVSKAATITRVTSINAKLKHSESSNQSPENISNNIVFSNQSTSDVQSKDKAFMSQGCIDDPSKVVKITGQTSANAFVKSMTLLKQSNERSLGKAVSAGIPSKAITITHQTPISTLAGPENDEFLKKILPNHMSVNAVNKIAIDRSPVLLDTLGKTKSSSNQIASDDLCRLVIAQQRDSGGLPSSKVITLSKAIQNFPGAICMSNSASNTAEISPCQMPLPTSIRVVDHSSDATQEPPPSYKAAIGLPSANLEPPPSYEDAIAAKSRQTVALGLSGQVMSSASTSGESAVAKIVSSHAIVRNSSSCHVVSSAVSANVLTSSQTTVETPLSEVAAGVLTASQGTVETSLSHVTAASDSVTSEETTSPDCRTVTLLNKEGGRQVFQVNALRGLTFPGVTELKIGGKTTSFAVPVSILVKTRNSDGSNACSDSIKSQQTDITSCASLETTTLCDDKQNSDLFTSTSVCKAPFHMKETSDILSDSPTPVPVSGQSFTVHDEDADSNRQIISTLPSFPDQNHLHVHNPVTTNGGAALPAENSVSLKPDPLSFTPIPAKSDNEGAAQQPVLSSSLSINLSPERESCQQGPASLPSRSVLPIDEQVQLKPFSSKSSSILPNLEDETISHEAVTSKSVSTPTPVFSSPDSDLLSCAAPQMQSVSLPSISVLSDSASNQMKQLSLSPQSVLLDCESIEMKLPSSSTTTALSDHGSIQLKPILSSTAVLSDSEPIQMSPVSSSTTTLSDSGSVQMKQFSPYTPAILSDSGSIHKKPVSPSTTIILSDSGSIQMNPISPSTTIFFPDDGSIQMKPISSSTSTVLSDSESIQLKPVSSSTKAVLSARGSIQMKPVSPTTTILSDSQFAQIKPVSPPTKTILPDSQFVQMKPASTSCTTILPDNQFVQMNSVSPSTTTILPDSQFIQMKPVSPSTTTIVSDNGSIQMKSISSSTTTSLSDNGSIQIKPVSPSTTILPVSDSGSIQMKPVSPSTTTILSVSDSGSIQMKPVSPSTTTILSVSDSGSIQMKPVSPSTTTIVSDNGSIQMKPISSSTATVMADNGSVQMKPVSLSTTTILSVSDSGSIQMKPVSPSTTTIVSDNGSIQMKPISSSTATVMADNGSVQMKPVSSSTTMLSVSGSIHMKSVSSSTTILSDTVSIQMKPVSPSTTTTPSDNVSIQMKPVSPSTTTTPSDSGSIQMKPVSPSTTTTPSDSGSIQMKPVSPSTTTTPSDSGSIQMKPVSPSTTTTPSDSGSIQMKPVSPSTTTTPSDSGSIQMKPVSPSTTTTPSDSGSIQMKPVSPSTTTTPSDSGSIQKKPLSPTTTPSVSGSIQMKPVSPSTTTTPSDSGSIQMKPVSPSTTTTPSDSGSIQMKPVSPSTTTTPSDSGSIQKKPLSPTTTPSVSGSIQMKPVSSSTTILSDNGSV